ncbi:MAG: hypothetical protein HY513_04010 [Candidatus Aenigmarchaeota archaeon]|nr:hypothetical protein [Candidatus Aenigmarchaeota archaeon]
MPAKKRSQRKARINQHSAAMPWDSLMIQLIVILLILLMLAFGAAYYAPILAGGAYFGDYEGRLSDPNYDQLTEDNTAGQAYIRDAEGQLVGGTAGAFPLVSGEDIVGSHDDYQNQIECNDGMDNDNDGLSDLEDQECKNSWDTSESTF